MKTPNIDFVGKRKLYACISIPLIMITLLCTLIFGAEVAIDFKGGTFINYSYDGTIDSAAFGSKAEEILGQKVVSTEGTEFSTGKSTVQISLVSPEGLTGDKQFELTNKLNDAFVGSNLAILNSSDVSPSSGRDFFYKSLVAVALASILIVLYIAFRFKRMSGWSAGVMAVVALLHDVLMVYGTFVIFRIPIDANFMAVVLTILGYSINDTIVIYDRIRENQHILGKKTPRKTLVNLSINQSLTRTIHTSVCTISAMIVVCIIAVIFRVDSIISFAFPVIIGMITGVYSTVCISGPLWVWWEDRKERKQAKKA